MLAVCILFVFVFFFKQKTAYELRISDWSSDVCSSDLRRSGWCACDTSDRWSPASSARRTSEAIANGEHRHPRREDRPAQPPATGKGRHRQAAQPIERAAVSRDRVAEDPAEIGREHHAESRKPAGTVKTGRQAAHIRDRKSTRLNSSH